MLNREELIILRERAIEESRILGLNEDWADAYRELARAADKLDAMMARCTETDPASTEQEQCLPTPGK